MRILELRMSGDTLEEIAEKLGYKNHRACSSASAKSDRPMKPTPVWTTALRAAKSSDNTYRKSIGVIFMPGFESALLLCVSRYNKQGLCVPQKSQSQPESADSLGAQPPIPRKERCVRKKICALPFV